MINLLNPHEKQYDKLLDIKNILLMLHQYTMDLTVDGYGLKEAFDESLDLFKLGYYFNTEILNYFFNYTNFEKYPLPNYLYKFPFDFTITDNRQSILSEKSYLNVPYNFLYMDRIRIKKFRETRKIITYNSIIYYGGAFFCEY